MSDQAEYKSFGTPDDTRSFELGEARQIKVGGADIFLLNFQPGWRWTEHVKHLAGTDLCELPHFMYHISGTLRVLMADGSEFDIQAGDVAVLSPGHDAWVVGDEPVVAVDWYYASTHANA